MARAMARPIPRDAPVIITSDLLMVVDRSSGPAEESDKDGGSDEKDEIDERKGRVVDERKDNTIKPQIHNRLN